MKGRALRRALETSDAHRVGGPGLPIPLITDTTEAITPEVAYEMLLKNTKNRPINWRKVDEYAELMRDGKWQLTAQGIILDGHGNILTGQKRLWAVIHANVTVYMRVSRGTPPSAANVIDRGDPQSARDLAARSTGRRHSPVEASLARAILAHRGVLRPGPDAIAAVISETAEAAARVVSLTRSVKKTRPVLMILAAILVDPPADMTAVCAATEEMARSLESVLLPQTPDRCWGHGAAFTLAMSHAKKITDKEAGQ